MKKILSLLMGLALVFSAAQVFAGGDGTVTKKYLVACMKCFAKHGGDPGAHASCDKSCSMMGTQLGLVDKDNNTYIPVDAAFKPLIDKLSDQSGQWIELTGVVVKTHGINFLQVTGKSPDDGKDSDSMGGSKMDKDGDSDSDN